MSLLALALVLSLKWSSTVASVYQNLSIGAMILIAMLHCFKIQKIPMKIVKFVNVLSPLVAGSIMLIAGRSQAAVPFLLIPLLGS